MLKQLLVLPSVVCITDTTVTHSQQQAHSVHAITLAQHSAAQYSTLQHSTAEHSTLADALTLLMCDAAAW